KVLLYQQLDRLSLRHANAVVTLCQPFVPVLRDRGVDERRIHVVTNCIEPQAPPDAAQIAALRASLKLGNEVVLLSVGRLSPEKGHSDLFEALRRIRAEAPSPAWRLLIVGDGGERERLKKEAAEFGEHIVFLGHQSNPAAYYHLADIFLLPSHSEG